VPFIVVLAAVGLTRLAQKTRHHRLLLAACGVVLVLLLAHHAVGLTNVQLGKREGPVAPEASVWYRGGEVQQLLARAWRREDLCGLTLVGIEWHWTGGYSYLHRDLPLLRGHHPLGRKTANYALVKDWKDTQMPAAFRRVETLGSYALYRRPGPCASPPPGYRQP
jgi:hypothetical protein